MRYITKAVIFDYPESVTVQLMDDSFLGDASPDGVVSYSVAIDTGSKAIALTQANDRNHRGNLQYQRLAEDRLTLDGWIDGRRLQMDLTRVDRRRFLLMNRGFRWISESAFNR